MISLRGFGCIHRNMHRRHSNALGEDIQRHGVLVRELRITISVPQLAGSKDVLKVLLLRVELVRIHVVAVTLLLELIALQLALHKR